MKKITITSKTVKALRTESGLNQLHFWHPLGVTQSGGSRYESGRSIPKPVRQLIYARYLMAPKLSAAQVAFMDAVK